MQRIRLIPSVTCALDKVVPDIRCVSDPRFWVTEVFAGKFGLPLALSDTAIPLVAFENLDCLQLAARAETDGVGDPIVASGHLIQKEPTAGRNAPHPNGRMKNGGVRLLFQRFHLMVIEG